MHIQPRSASLKNFEAQSRSLGHPLIHEPLSHSRSQLAPSSFLSTAPSSFFSTAPSSPRQPCSKFFLLYSSTGLAAVKAWSGGGPGLERRQQ
jgi:hypothetical protein